MPGKPPRFEAPVDSWWEVILDWVLKSAFAGLAVGSIIGIATVIYADATAETFELRKGEWRCTASHEDSVTTYTQVGQVTVPTISFVTVCDQWSRR